MVAFVLLVAVLQAACGNAIRAMQSRTRNVYVAIAGNYAVAFVLAVAYCLARGVQPSGAPAAIGVGLFTGFFYTVALVAIIRSMGQRGMAVTLALSSLAMLVPVLVAIGFGERPGLLQVTGMVTALAAMPLLSLATVSGAGIRERPSLHLALFLFLVQGAAMSGNLLATKLVEPPAMPLYLAVLFGAGSIFSLGLWAFMRGPSEKRDVGWGALFGLLNVSCTLAIVTALAYVPGSIFFAVVGVVALTMTVATAVLFWREKTHTWGWVGLGLTAVAVCLMVLE